MAKQQIKFSLNATQVRTALEQYAATMFDSATYAVEVAEGVAGVHIVATRKRAARKAKAPKVAAVKAAA